MDKEFSEGFIHDLADIMGYCKEKNTDGCQVELDCGEYTLVVDFTFSIK